MLDRRFNDQLAAKVRKFRTDKGVSQEFMADSIGISSSSYSQKELGNVSFRCDELHLIGQILQINFFSNILR